MSELVDLRTSGRTAVITLRRPEKRNALTIELCDLVRDAATGAVADGARSLVVTGEGTSFCAGADLDAVYGDTFREALYGMLQTLTTLPIPVVAAVNGPAIGAGTQIAIACDVRVAAPTAAFAIPTAGNALAVDPWTIRRFSLLAGNSAARAALLGLEKIDASRAHALGLADRLGDLDDAVAWADQMAELAPLTLAYSKQVLNTVFEPEFDAATAAELGKSFDACWTSEDFAEARAARLEKRKPVFRGL
ncbi:MAG: enoyl-CoA hydratase [Pseudonocardia sp. SCN 72-86]|nr:MAG: enoyl-CoA hydratase [Pseudonocardia sp. SCN 72-86]